MKTTCGPIYRKVREMVMDDIPVMDIPKTNRMFALGFVAGQAEKVYLGAASAAMFRPTSSVGREFLLTWVRAIAKQYGLHFRILEYMDPDGEITEEILEYWVLRNDNSIWMFEAMKDRRIIPNSPAWHHCRGDLTGVPDREIDEGFHLREGWTDDIDGKLDEEKAEDTVNTPALQRLRDRTVREVYEELIEQLQNQIKALEE